MADQTNNSGSTPAGNAGNTPGNTGAQGSAQQQGVAQPENNPRARGHSPAQDARQQQQTPAEVMVKFADGSEYKEADLRTALGERAEVASKKATLPASPDQYRIELPADFVPPENVRFEFDSKDPALARARELAHKRGIDQETFSEMLGVYASTKMGEAIQQAKLRDTNMRALGTAAPQRVEAVATWLQARAGPEGKAFADFLRKFPSSQIVKATENLMRAFSNQGGSDFSQSHRAAAEDPGKIPGYENMSFAQKRAYQMAQMMSKPGYRGRNER